MKQIFSFFFIPLFMIGLCAQDNLAINKFAEPGKVYTKCRLKYEAKPVEDQPAKVLKFIGTEWKVEVDTIYRDTLEEEGYQHVLTKEASLKWVYYNKVDRNCLSVNPMDCVVLAYVEIPATYRSIYFGETDSFKLVQVERIVHGPMIELIDNICTDLPIEKNTSRLVLADEHQNLFYIKMAAGLWSEWREMICSGGCGPGYTVKDIQIKMKALGYYKGPVNNQMDDGLKQALTKFQQVKGLPIGRLDIETLRVLGIQY